MRHHFALTQTLAEPRLPKKMARAMNPLPSAFQYEMTIESIDSGGSSSISLPLSSLWL